MRILVGDRVPPLLDGFLGLCVLTAVVALREQDVANDIAAPSGEGL